MAAKSLIPDWFPWVVGGVAVAAVGVGAAILMNARDVADPWDSPQLAIRNAAIVISVDKKKGEWRVTSELFEKVVNGAPRDGVIAGIETFERRKDAVAKGRALAKEAKKRGGFELVELVITPKQQKKRNEQKTREMRTKLSARAAT